MSFAEVFKINSDMKKPLNELFVEHLGLGASDSVLKVLISSKTTGSGFSYSFIPSVNGSIRLNVMKDAYPSRPCYVSVLENGDELFNDTIGSDDSSMNSFDFNIKKENTYKIVLSGSGYDISLNYAKLCGSIVDPTLVELL